MTTDRDRSIIEFVRSIYGDGFIALHRPVFAGNEKQYLSECIDSSYVSTAGTRVNDFEGMVARFVGARHAIATVNGTAALHVALLVAGVQQGDEVISQALTFIATCNAIRYVGAQPVFVDVDQDTMGMSPAALQRFLGSEAVLRDGRAYNSKTGRRIAACVPMHTFGMPCRIQEIADICARWHIPMIEDAAESLGSRVGDRHTGTFGCAGVLSFNGNKIVTTGGGGMVVTNDDETARHARHLATTAKVPHATEFVHDEVGYNYRLPNLNATLGCAQMEQLPGFLAAKKSVADRYSAFFESIGVPMSHALPGTTTNSWLNAIVLGSMKERDAFLAYSNEAEVMSRPIWRLMSSLPMFRDCQSDGLPVSRWLEERVVNIPSSVPAPSTSGVA